MRQEGFTPIGQIGATVTHQSRREDGNNVGQIVAAPSPQSMRVVQWLEARTPSEVDKVLQSQALSHNVALRVRFDTRSSRDSNGNVTTDFVVRGADAVGQIEDMQEVAAKVASALTPPDSARIEAWLAEMSVLVVRGKGDQFSDTLRIVAYAKRLAEYPTDVVRAALLDCKWQFWPSWSDLSDFCDELAAPRRAMAAALTAAINKPKPAYEPEAKDGAFDAASIMEAAGFTQARTQAVRASPMAGTVEEAMTRAKQRTPHWSESAAPDDPRWAMVRASRANSTVLPPVTHDDDRT